MSLRAGTASVLVLSCVVISWSCAGEDPATRYLADAEALERGRAVFVGTCSGYCHAVGIEVGDAPDLFDCEWRYGRSNQEIFNTISEGVPNSRMIGFGGKLPDGDDDIWKIIAFLKSRAPGC